MSPIFLALIFFLAFFTLSVSGFGHALVAMPLLTPALGVRMAAPLMALASMTGEIIMLIRHRRNLNFKAVSRLALASAIGIPIGVLVTRSLDETLVMTVLGIVAAGYGLYGLLNLHLPKIHNPIWAYGFGFISGLLSGAYNTGGPPVVIYGNLSRWSPTEFKGSLQGMFVLNSLLIVCSHALIGNVTLLTLENYLIALPAIALGLLVGFRVEKRLNPALFRKLVLVLLIVLGVRLILTGGG
ncbi:MAG TPA: sulfite exporter TauE/SafE family protein [Phototrophicaceae bacterium]|nr:sulfite exporter TauE/SafE family protein [Phototrophicaceae bacterium]